MSESIDDLLLKYALLNAVRHQGKARPGPVVGQLLSERPDLRPMAEDLTRRASATVKEVNSLAVERQRALVQERWPELLEEKRVEAQGKTLPPLPNAERYASIVTRYAPNPDFVLHFGQARAIYLSYDYARMYHGIFILRFEDTDPKLKRPRLEYYDAIREDIEWLGCKWDAEYIQSQRMPTYYEYAAKMLQAGQAYVCTCQTADFKQRILARQACPCRGLAPEEELNRWERMLNGGYGERDAVVRVKTDLNHPNPAVRDWVALRVINTRRVPHPIVGDRYMVWPTYNFAAGLDDHLMGVTHIIRGKEFLPSVTRQSYLYKHLGWKYPEAIHYGKWMIRGMGVVSKSKFLKGLREGLFKDWDDPRLATLAALRRRGIMPETIHKMILEVGTGPSEATLSWENLYAYNKKVVDPIANRYFFVASPVQMTVQGVKGDREAHPPLHPSFRDRGRRTLKVKASECTATVLVSASDVARFKEGEPIRLMELFNVRITSISPEGVTASYLSDSHVEAREMGARVIHWIPRGSGIPTEVLMPDASTVAGLSEDACAGLRPGEIVQFERFGFARVDSTNGKITARFAHS
ncbi:MAG: glutamate--tRNA ligase [Candidatus Bathyarchaeia archaeon]